MTTVVVTGSARGGTTCVAGIVKRLGVPFPGAELRLERPELMRRTRDPYGFPVEPTFRAQDDLYPIWGMKEPDFDRNPAQAEKLIGQLCMPRVIYVWRDWWAILSNRAADEGHSLAGELELLHNDYLTRYRMLYSLDRLKVPVLHVSYEKLLLNREEQVTRIRNWLVLDTDIAEAVASITPGSYIE